MFRHGTLQISCVSLPFVSASVPALPHSCFDRPFRTKNAGPADESLTSPSKNANFRISVISRLWAGPRFVPPPSVFHPALVPNEDPPRVIP